MSGKTNGLNDADGRNAGKVSHQAGFCSTFFAEKASIERPLGTHKRTSFV